MTTVPSHTAVTRRPCGCVCEAGHPDLLGDMPGAVLVPTAEFRALPWACPACDVGAATERAAAIAEGMGAADVAAAIRGKA